MKAGLLHQGQGRGPDGKEWEGVIWINVPENLESPDSPEQCKPTEVTHFFPLRALLLSPCLEMTQRLLTPPQDSSPTHPHPSGGMDPQNLSFLATRILIPTVIYS